MSRGTTAWNNHVRAVRRAHPGMSLSEAMKEGSRSWHSKKGADLIRYESREGNPSYQKWIVIGLLVLGGYLVLTQMQKQQMLPKSG